MSRPTPVSVTTLRWFLVGLCLWAAAQVVALLGDEGGLENWLMLAAVALAGLAVVMELRSRRPTS